MIARLAVLLVLLLGACAPPEDPPAWHGRLDLSALPAEHAAVYEAAMAAWGVATDGQVAAQRADGATGALPVVLGAPPDGDVAYYDGARIVTQACDTSTPDGFDACLHAAEHELGHWFGARHVCATGAVMYWRAHAGTALTPDDVAEVLAANGSSRPAECNNGVSQ